MSSNRSLTRTKGFWRGSFRLALLSLCLLGSGPAAWAACTRAAEFSERVVDMDMGRVVIPEEVPVGGVIASKRFPIKVSGASEAMFRCTNGGGTATGVMLQGTEIPGNPEVFSTDVAGVGIRLSRMIAVETGTVYYPHRLYLSVAGSQNFDAHLIAGSFFQVELIKTQSVPGNGQLASGVYTRYYADGDGRSAITTVLSGSGISIVMPSCSVDAGSRNIPVLLGSVPLDSFKGIGSTSRQRDFKIVLHCRAGQNAQNTVYLRLDAQQDSSNHEGVLKIAEGSGDSAAGVGIQLLDAHTMAVRFGEDVAVGPSIDGSYVLPYSARYFRTGTVEPGRADGTATFTVSYK